jgi:hypothetical protein
LRRPPAQRAAEAEQQQLAVTPAARALVPGGEQLAQHRQRQGGGLLWRDKPTNLARALSEIGRIAKTIHILHYIDDPEFRRRILTQLNHTELRHRLGRRIHHGERGEIRSPLQQGQEEQLGSLGLALNAVVHWNPIYMQEAIRHVRQEGMDVHNDDIAHLSPLIWRHLNFLGRYDFSLPDTVMNGGLRPLRNPTSAWDF